MHPLPQSRRACPQVAAYLSSLRECRGQSAEVEAPDRTCDTDYGRKRREMAKVLVWRSAMTGMLALHGAVLGGAGGLLGYGLLQLYRRYFRKNGENT
jgi:hypothetical protein